MSCPPRLKFPGISADHYCVTEQRKYASGHPLEALRLKSGRYISFIALAVFVALCLVPGEAFGLNWLNRATSNSTSLRSIAPPTPHNTLSFLGDAGVVSAVPNEWTSVSLNGAGQPNWYEATSDDGTASSPVPRSGGLLIVAVAASWLVTCITRNRRGTVHYGRDWTMPSSVHPSLREEADLGLLGSRRDVSLDTRVGAKH